MPRHPHEGERTPGARRGPGPRDEDPQPHHDGGTSTPPAGPLGGGYLINDVSPRDLTQIGGFLESVGGELRADGETVIGGLTIRPPSTPRFVARYERMPKGELKLLFELEWDPQDPASDRLTSPDVVGEKADSVVRDGDDGGPGGEDDSVVGDETADVSERRMGDDDDPEEDEGSSADPPP